MPAFARSVYYADNGSIHPIRLSQEALDAQPVAPTPSKYTNRISAKISRGKYEMGLKPRGLNLVRKEISGEVIQTFRKFFPILDNEIWESAKTYTNIDVGLDEWDVASISEESHV